VTSYEELLPVIGEVHGRGEDIRLPEPAMHEIPVLYGGKYGPDLEFVSEYWRTDGGPGDRPSHGFSLHCLRCRFYAWVPYPSADRLDKRLFTPRLETPRLKVAGRVSGSCSVADRDIHV